METLTFPPFYARGQARAFAHERKKGVTFKRKGAPVPRSPLGYSTLVGLIPITSASLSSVSVQLLPSVHGLADAVALRLLLEPSLAFL